MKVQKRFGHGGASGIGKQSSELCVDLKSVLCIMICKAAVFFFTILCHDDGCVESESESEESIVSEPESPPAPLQAKRKRLCARSQRFSQLLAGVYIN